VEDGFPLWQADTIGIGNVFVHFADQVFGEAVVSIRDVRKITEELSRDKDDGVVLHDVFDCGAGVGCAGMAGAQRQGSLVGMRNGFVVQTLQRLQPLCLSSPLEYGKGLRSPGGGLIGAIALCSIVPADAAPYANWLVWP
jgi:hypothetical protein